MRLILGDCLEEMKNIESGSIDLVLTDPPYLIDYKTNYRKDKDHDFCKTIENDQSTDVNVISQYFTECHRIMKDNTAGYIFCSSKKVDVFKQLLELHFKIKNQIIWVKNNHTAGDLTGQFGQKYEIIFLVAKGNPKIKGYRFTDVWGFDRVSGKKQQHQNQKPVDLLERCITSHCIDHGVVFDGFMGSGSTGVACVNTNRDFIGIEKDPGYFKIAEERIRKSLT